MQRGGRDVVQDLDMAFMGAFGARHGRLSVTGDLTLIGLGVGLSEIVAEGPQRLFEVAPGGRLTERASPRGAGRRS